MAKSFSVQEFLATFSTDDACLDHLMETRYGKELDCPKCGRHGKFSRIKSIPAYSCAWCGHHIHPMAGTPFENSRTPLQKWFYAMYLFTTSRHGVPAKELQRQLSVTYKCAWRIGHEIRKYMGKVDGSDPLGGKGKDVEADETYIGGRTSNHKTGLAAAQEKVCVMGMLERGGEVMTHVIPAARRTILHPLIEQNIRKETTVHTDEHLSYRNLYLKGYDHQRVNHSSKEYVRGNVHVNSLEGFWSMLKRSIRGTHVWVSAKHMDKYLGEFEYRYNMRKAPQWMLVRLLASF